MKRNPFQAIVGLIFGLILSFPLHSFGQGTSLAWMRKVGGTGNNWVTSVKADGNGNVFFAGVFRGTMELDLGSGTQQMVSSGLQDIFVGKSDAGGNLAWIFSIGTVPSDETVRAIDVDSTGNVYVAGTFGDTMDIDPGPGITLLNAWEGGNFVCKFNPNGDLIWGRNFGINVSLVSLWDIAVDAPGNVAIAGDFKGAVDFYPGPNSYVLNSPMYRSVFVSVLDENGNFLWAKSMGGNTDADGHAVDIDRNGNVILTGRFTQTIDFDPGVGTYYLTSPNVSTFVCKLDSNGDFIWAKGFMGSGGGQGFEIDADSANNVLISGTFGGSVDFDPGAGTYLLNSIGATDLYICKLNSSGSFEWAKQIGGTNSISCKGMDLDPENGIYIAGYFSGTFDFDPSPATFNLTAVGIYNAYALKLANDGSFEWAGRFGGQGIVSSEDISVDASKNIFVGGIFAGTPDFDPGPDTLWVASDASNDGFLLKLRSCIPSIGVATISSCDSMTWLDGITYFSDNDTAQFTVFTPGMCDSILTLNLQILNSTWSTDPIFSCDSVLWIDGNVYSSSNNSATAILMNSVGCDSVVTLNLTIPVIDTGITSIGSNLSSNTIGATSYQWGNCENGWTPIPGANSQNFTVSNSGSYAVAVSIGACSDTSSCENIVVLSSELGAIATQALIYPNPTNGKCILRFDELQFNTTIQVLSSQGSLLESFFFDELLETEIDLRYPDGIYFLQAVSGTGRGSLQSIIIQK